MSKEELERVSVQELSSSVPPRRASQAPASLPSTPPVTDEIDTDWGEDDSSHAAPDWAADDSNEVTHVMDKPLRVVFTPPPPADPDLKTSPVASVAPQEEPTPELETSPNASPSPPEAEADGAGRVLSMRPKAPTLIGLPAPTLPDSVEGEEQSTPEKRESAPPPMPSAAFSEPVRASSVPPPPPPPAPIAAPSAPPPPAPSEQRAAPSTPPPSASAVADQSSRLPAVTAPSTPPAARPSAPPARSSVPAPRVLSSTPEAVDAAQAGRHSSGFGRWLLVLAAGLVVVCVFGYRVLNRQPAALTEASHSNTSAEPTATAEPAPTPSAAETRASELATPPTATAPGTTASAATPEPADSAPTPEASASAAPSASASPSADGEKRKVTVKSKPAKVRFFHFGKLVGVTPFVLEFKPGEKHAYEAGLPGYGTRKVVIDGSKPEILIGLTREKP